jgi:hypothetical protein
MAFNPDEYLRKVSSPAPAAPAVKAQPQPAFDPDAYLSKNRVELNPGPAAQTFLESTADTLTLGNLPRLQAGAGGLVGAKIPGTNFAPIPDPSAEVDEQLRAQGFNIQEAPNDYITRRDANYARRAKQAEEFPAAENIGKVTGLALSVPVLGAATRAATLGGRAVQAAKAGAVTGALANPGDVEGEASGLQLEERGKGAFKGAVTAAALQAGGEKILGPIAKKAQKFFSERAAKKATKALGPTKKQLERLQQGGQDVKVGRQLLDEGAIPVLGTPGRIAKRVEAMSDEAGAEIGSIVKGAGPAQVIDADTLANDLAQEFNTAALKKVPGASKQVAMVDELLDTLRSNGKMSLEQTQALRRAVDKQINFAKKTPELRGMQEYLYRIRTKLRDAMNDAPTGGGLKAANQRYSRAETASDILEGKMARDESNRAFSLTDTIAAGAGLSGGGTPAEKAVLAAGAAAANKFARTFGASIGARGNDAVSRLFGDARKLATLTRKYPVAVSALTQRAAQPKSGLTTPDGVEILNDPQVIGIFESNPELIEAIQDPKLRERLQKRLRGPSSK